jgi:hypothetical protein
MKTSSRALIGFGIGIAVLVIVTIVLVLTIGKGNPPLLQEKTPQGVVQRYLLAVQEKDFKTAYNYLVPPNPNDPNYVKGYPFSSYDDWVMSASYSGNSSWKARLGKVTISGEAATVEVFIDVFRPGGPFGNSINTNNITFVLKTAADSWLITSPTELYWQN